LLFHIEHETRLEFSQMIQQQYCELRVSPISDAFQSVRYFEIETDPPVELRRYTDAFGNDVHCFEILSLHMRLVTRARSVVETHLDNPFGYDLWEPARETLWFKEALSKDPTLWQYVAHRSPATPAFESLKHNRPGVPVWDHDFSIQKSILDGMNWAASVLTYEPGVSETHSPLVEVVKAGKGVCQDFAHLMISLIRSWGLPARYVMGYTETEAENFDGSLTENATHAWAEVLIPGVGWRGFDATNRLAVNDRYVRVAVGRDYLDAAPQRGTFKGDAVAQSPHVKLVMTHPPSQAQILVGSGPSTAQSAQ
jgi:transglutaminase-like putative cysteine protease